MPAVPSPRRFLPRDAFIVGMALVGVSVLGWFVLRSLAPMPLFSSALDSDRVVREEGTLVIAYDQPLLTYEPTASGVVQRAYLADVVEPLLRFDRDFNLEPVLALSWGMIDDTTWEFKLRPEVTFHDGSTVEADDVVASVERAAFHPYSDLTTLVASIEEVEVVDSLTVRFHTTTPDAMLLSKLTLIPIVPEELLSEVNEPVGTGPYAFFGATETRWTFTRYESYWGRLPSYPEVVFESLPEKFERYEAFVSGEVDVLAQVPPVFVDALLTMDYPIASVPSLEVGFLLFDLQDSSSLLASLEVRQAIRLALDPAKLEALTSGYAHPISQFVSRGVFGYEPGLVEPTYDLARAAELAAPYTTLGSLSLDFPAGMESLGGYVETQLEAIGLVVETTYWPVEDYAQRVRSEPGDLTFLAWRSELADAGEFLEAVVHSPDAKAGYGRLNSSRFLDSEIDELIEISSRNVLSSVRLEQLQEIMTLIVDDRVIGVPLFESDSLVAIQPDLSEWEPRLDNLILPSDFQ